MGTVVSMLVGGCLGVVVPLLVSILLPQSRWSVASGAALIGAVAGGATIALHLARWFDDSRNARILRGAPIVSALGGFVLWLGSSAALVASWMSLPSRFVAVALVVVALTGGVFLAAARWTRQLNDETPGIGDSNKREPARDER